MRYASAVLAPLRALSRKIVGGLELESLVQESVLLVLLVGTMLSLAHRIPY
jgi:hypothetical protein